jgi:hypothetical protein
VNKFVTKKNRTYFVAFDGASALITYVTTKRSTEKMGSRDTTDASPRKGDERVVSVERAGEVFGLSRASAYRAAHRWLDTGGAEGLPVVVLSRRRMLVPIAALEQLLETACPLAS